MARLGRLSTHGLLAGLMSIIGSDISWGWFCKVTKEHLHRLGVRVGQQQGTDFFDQYCDLADLNVHEA